MIDAKELHEKYEMTEEEITDLEQSAEHYENEQWPEGKVVRIGRPPLYDNDVMERVTIRIKRSSLRRIDAFAQASGVSRSDFIRQAADERLDALSNS